MPDVIMPRLSDTMSEGILAQWLKHEGEQVQRGDVLAEVETDKATMELEAYASGVLTRIIAAPGTTVPIGQTVAVIGEPDEPPGPDSAPQAVTPSVTAAPAGRVGTNGTVPPPGSATGDGRSVRTSPLARALARKHGLDLAAVVGSGPGGRIVRADVEAAIAGGVGRPPRPGAGSRPEAMSWAAGAPALEDERVPLTSIRRITAQRLTESAGAPHFYLSRDVDADALLALRADLNAQLGDSAPKISVTDLLARAAAVTLRAHPGVNSSWGGDHLLRHGHVNVGIAVALDGADGGLIVPVIRDADRKSVRDIATEARDLAERARSGKLRPDEFNGGTFTISNLGMYGITAFTAVINPPEAAILAVGAAREQLVLRSGVPKAVSRLSLTLTVDHRVLDGASGAAFLRDLVGLLEAPLRILV